MAICGGTDVMVEVNFDQRRPDVLLDLTRIEELREWGPADRRIRLGSARHVRHDHRRAGHDAARPRDRLTYGRLAADPQPRHRRRQPRRRVARGRLPSRPARH
ncbi:MAG: FAD binding domain-containing protein [Nocardioidaceae bacterium]